VVEGSSENPLASRHKRASWPSAPELAVGQQYDAKVDVFSMGCILFELAAGKRVFQSQIQYQEYITSESRIAAMIDDVHGSWRHELSHLIVSMLETTTYKRPAARDLRIASAANLAISVGDMYQTSGKSSKAIEVYQTALGLGFDIDPVIWRRLGDSYKTLDKYKDAIEAYAKAVGPPGGLPSSTIRDDLSDALSAGSHQGLAVETYKLAIKMDPSNSVLWALAGDAYLSDKDYESAIKMYRKAIKRGLSDAVVLAKLAAAYSKIEDYDRAIKAYNAAVNVCPVASPDLLAARTRAYAAKEKASTNLRYGRRARIRKWFAMATGKSSRRDGVGAATNEASGYDTQFSDTDDEGPLASSGKIGPVTKMISSEKDNI
jgi:tetratricopeptide (TPR) repeat protein